ncbi:MAG: hypothetical protein ACE5HQ_11445 [Gemmatimonadota bacterium]
MIVRVVTYPAEPLDTAKEWTREHGPEVRGAPGVREAYFISREQPAQIGAIQLFDSRADLRRYTEGDVYQRLYRSLRDRLGPETRPLTEEVYEVIEV